MDYARAGEVRRGPVHDCLRPEEAGGQPFVMARRAHGGGDRAAGNADFEWLLDRYFIGHAIVFAVFFSAKNAAGTDPLHARSSHERKRANKRSALPLFVMPRLSKHLFIFLLEPRANPEEK